MDMSMLSNVLSVDKSTTTRLVAPLIIRNLVVKEKSQKDLRMILLKLTEEGRTAHKRIHQCLASFVRAIQAEIPSDKRKACLDGIRVFLNSMQSAADRRYDVIKK